MPMKGLSLVVLAFIVAFSRAPNCSAIPRDGQARQHPLDHPIGARDWLNVSFPLTQAPPPNPSITVPNVSPTTTCQTYNCNLFYQVSRITLSTSI